MFLPGSRADGGSSTLTVFTQYSCSSPGADPLTTSKRREISASADRKDTIDIALCRVRNWRYSIRQRIWGFLLRWQRYIMVAFLVFTDAATCTFFEFQRSHCASKVAGVIPVTEYFRSLELKAKAVVRCKTLRFGAQLQHCTGIGCTELQHTWYRSEMFASRALAGHHL